MSSISNKRAKTVHQLTSEELSENIASNIQSLLELQRTKESEFNEKSRTFDEKCAAKMQSEKEKAEKLIADAKKKAEKIVNDAKNSATQTETEKSEWVTE